MRREQLLLDPADRQDPATEGDLPRHRDVAPDPPARERRHDRGRHGHARRRSVLRDGPGRYVDVHRVVLEESLGDPELALVGPHVAEGRARGLLHDLLDLAGEDELLGLRALIHDRRLDGQHVATGLAHRYAGDRSDLVLFLGQAEVEALGAEVGRELGRVDRDALGLVLGDLPRDLPADRADLALEVPDAGLARVQPDHVLQRRVSEDEAPVLETVLLQLPRQEVADRDVQLLILGVAGEPDDLHPVTERRDDRVLHVRRRDEDDP